MVKLRCKTPEMVRMEILAHLPAPPFVVLEPSGVAFLDASGAEQERVRTGKGAAISPDGRWVAVAECAADPARPELVIRPRGHKADPIRVPLLVDREARAQKIQVPKGGPYRIALVLLDWR